MECFKNIVHYESTIIIPLSCIQLAKLKSCSVWCFSGKKAVVTSGEGGIWSSPGRRPCPTYPPYQNKNGKNQPFLAFYIFATPPHPHLNKNNLVQPLEKGLCTLGNSWDLAMDFDSRQINLSVLFLELPASISWFCG